MELMFPLLRVAASIGLLVLILSLSAVRVARGEEGEIPSEEQNSLKLKEAERLPESPEETARRYAPVFLTEAKRYNIPLPIDFDEDWIADNNASNYDFFLEKNRGFIQNPYGGISPLKPTIYYEAIETKTHLFLTYYLFFPFDAGDYHTFEPGQTSGGHNNDATSLMIIVEKGMEEYRLLTQHHGETKILESANARLYEGRFVIHITSGNHALKTLKGGKTLPEENTPDRRSIFYFRHGENGEEYQLKRVFDALWPHRTDKDLFGKFHQGIGIQFRGNNAPFPPWARAFGSKAWSNGLAKSFFDPAEIFCDPFAVCSKEYIQNPYR